jgi:hypothetical protein
MFYCYLNYLFNGEKSMVEKVKMLNNKVIGGILLFIGWILLAFILSNSRLDFKLDIEYLFGFILVDFIIFLIGISLFLSINIKEIFKNL